jgi:hypothetical protein
MSNWTRWLHTNRRADRILYCVLAVALAVALWAILTKLEVAR